MSDLWTMTWLLAAISALSVGLAKGGLGGFAFVNIVIMAELLPAKQSVGTVLLMLIVGDFYSVRAYGRHTNWSWVRRLVPPIFAGVLLGAFLLDRLPNELFRQIIGWVVLLMAVLQILRHRFGSRFDALAQSPLYRRMMGGSAGVCTMLANAAGPLMQLYFLSIRAPKMEFIGTMAWLFLIINLSKVPLAMGLGILSWDSFYLVAVLAPFIVLGVILAKAIISWISQGFFEVLVLAFTFAAALRLILG